MGGDDPARSSPPARSRGTLGIVYGVASIWATPTYATNLVQLIGLGIAVDYSLLIVYRFREELAAGQDVDDAVVRTMQTAGRAVVFSGIAVALGLALLVAMPLPFIRMLGVAGFLIPVVSILAAVTLQPVLLSLLRPARHRAPPGAAAAGRRAARARLLGRGSPRSIMARPRRLPGGRVGGARSRWRSRRFWHPAHARLDLRDPADVAVGARLRPAAARRSGPGRSRRPRSSSRRSPARCSPRRRRRRSRRLLGSLEQDPEVAKVYAGSGRHFVDPTRRYEQVLVAGRHDYGFPQEQALREAAARAR